MAGFLLIIKISKPHFEILNSFIYHLHSFEDFPGESSKEIIRKIPLPKDFLIHRDFFIFMKRQTNDLRGLVCGVEERNNPHCENSPCLLDFVVESWGSSTKQSKTKSKEHRAKSTASQWNLIIM